MMDAYGLIGGLVLALGVFLGATYAHRWRPRLDPERARIFETANRQHLLHGLALVLVASLGRSGAFFVGAGVAYLVGLLLFSGTLYHRALTDSRVLSRMAPLGGLAFMAGHLLLGLGFLMRLLGTA